MIVAIKLGTALSQFRPDAEKQNQFTLTLNEGDTTATVIATLKIPDDQRLMIIVNGNMVARPDVASHEMFDGDTLSLMTPIHAG